MMLQIHRWSQAATKQNGLRALLPKPIFQGAAIPMNVESHTSG